MSADTDKLTAHIVNIGNELASMQQLIERIAEPITPPAVFQPRIMGQRDPLWAAKPLGTRQAADTSVIGKYGCVVTSIAYLANAAEGADKYTPIDVQNMLLSVGGFVAGDPPTYNLVAWSAVPQIFPKLKLTLIKDTPGPLTAADFDALRQRISAGVPVILGVDYTKTNQKKPNHYVCLTDLLFNTVSVKSLDSTQAANNGSLADPYYQDSGPIAPRYGKSLSEAVLRYVIYDRVVAP